jgi:tetratricopeptide (TPR) repeat protein
MKHLKLMLIIILYLALSLKGEEKDKEYFKPLNIRRFADYLFEEEQYIKAAGEYGRYLFAKDSFPQNADSIFFRIALCYRRKKDYKNSINYFRKISHKYPESHLLETSYLEIGTCYSLMDSFALSNEILKSSQPKDSTLKNRAGELISLNYMQNKQWNEARKSLNFRASNKKQLFSLIEKGENLPKKNKLVSGLFSAVIPGSGKLYCNRPADAFHSFTTVSLTCWQAYEGFEEDGIHSVKGWIFGVLGGLLYLGNIYGSVVAADIYNEEQEIMFKLSVKKYLNENFK